MCAVRVRHRGVGGVFSVSSPMSLVRRSRPGFYLPIRYNERAPVKPQNQISTHDCQFPQEVVTKIPENLFEDLELHWRDFWSLE
jgi:hypothetical protein